MDDRAAPRIRLCVYCGAHRGARPSYATSARQVGRAIVTHGGALVYGGGHIGLMGDVADAALEGGAPVTGIITEHLMGLEVGHSAVTELVVVADMPARKRAMFDRSDAFAVLPGGVGTMEEFFEVWCWATLGLHTKPLGLLNTDGYYDTLLEFIDRATAEGMVDPNNLDQVTITDDPDELVSLLFERARVGER